ncbi:polyamine aminopropyltransferase [Prochlorothrix hollandica]|uniref:Polyamine aminopropyltransferase n=1 Tax=Prochlorothrix hollandica PCC 9006 = CALU 1027 TaxID=317619 RepID=A0A0M2PZV9_PROHO|nr:polyamine aminopropyltransferase [Prochlorothrix hollandica]KKI99916.1 spermidine synthase [Prochlorothrix hollandica PCC 9006 = CALU 1027]KKI99955.1 spermidine synthase [Prochlorothrix hollandica PCC 9006 = CALU 1027]
MVSLPLDPNLWLIDGSDTYLLGIRHHGQVLFDEQSPYQRVRIYDTIDHGKMLTVDSLVMCTEKDESAYHEMIIQVPMVAHGAVKDVLIIGGGDGGSVREVVRHPGVDRVTMVEIDEVVVRASQQFLPSLACAFDHPKLTLMIDDGIAFMDQAADASFDLIVVDSSDPVGPAEGLFTSAFYQQVYRCLKPGGVMTVQSESPSFNQSAFRALHHCLRGVFGADQTHCYLTVLPTYPTGIWSFNYCTKGGAHPFHSLDRSLAATVAQTHNLRYYNADIHTAAFQLPTFIQQLLTDGAD